MCGGATASGWGSHQAFTVWPMIYLDERCVRSVTSDDLKSDSQGNDDMWWWFLHAWERVPDLCDEGLGSDEMRMMAVHRGD